MKRWLPRLGIGRANSHSLRYQLLSRSLFIVAALLLLIGLSQYWVTKDTLYRSQAEAMGSQMMTIARGLSFSAGRYSPDGEQALGDHAPGGEPSFGEPGFGERNSGSLPRPPGDGAEIGGAEAGGEQQPPERRFLLMPDTSLAYISPEGEFSDISERQGDGKSAPQLGKEEYAALLATMSPGKPDDYRLLTGQDGREQLVIFHLVRLPQTGAQGLIQLGTATAMIKGTLMQQLLTFILLSVLALGGGLALYSSVIRRTLVPLTNINTVVEQIDAGKLNNRLPSNQGQQEIARLSAAFNGMLERLKSAFDAERDAKERMEHFIADASHELRTPLTSILGFLEVLQRGAAQNPEQLKSALQSMHGESLRLNKLVEDLLLLTKFDRDAELSRRDIGIKALLEELKPHLVMLGGSRKLTLDADPKLRGFYDADKLKQVVLNLFHNAVQHTSATNGEISISALPAPDKQALLLSVRDNGYGIEAEHLEHVFERFYRSDSSRTRKSGGAGLGLAITRSIVEAHGGTIQATSKKGAGSTFTVRLPL